MLGALESLNSSGRSFTMFFRHLHQIYGQGNITDSFWGGFAGAFFAFLFGIITYVITKRRERFVLHRNTLIRLERVLLKHLYDLDVLQSVIVDSEAIIGTGKVTSNRLIKLDIPDDMSSGLGSLTVANKFLIYQISIERLNFNSDSINRALTRLEDLFVGGQIPHVENFNFVRSTLVSFNQELPGLNERIKKFLVIVRLNISKLKTKIAFVQGITRTKWELEISDEETRREREKLDSEGRHPAGDF
ncbi:MAG: hypothetical protein KGJ90_05245 [Patescibacteria group bacterium]|nr:hypothetical protein [Patescibacteria group bacterium]